MATEIVGGGDATLLSFTHIFLIFTGVRVLCKQDSNIPVIL